MYDLQELREKIEAQDYEAALQIIGELEEMSLEDKINKIYSYTVVLLVHLIKQEAEKRTTSSWDRSIFNSVKYIKKTNKRRKSGGYYLDELGLMEIIDEAYDHALHEAAFEAFEGKLALDELEEKFNPIVIKNRAIALLSNS